ncbi:MAG TPA: GNAT family N-acyltransferase [Dissulfurispiraceae bacterium]|nr:GNAT family N-acyltransferase [Dissulfurispiraceae bacterium]
MPTTEFGRVAQQSRFIFKQAISSEDIASALRLRFDVFNVEMNEGLQSSWATGMDTDEYDAICDHIIVVDTDSGEAVGTYRLLPGKRAEESLGYYSETEFELSAIRRLSANKLELGRACVHPAYRGSTVLHQMWAGIAHYIDQHDIQFLFGCGSIHTINPHILSSVNAYFANYLTPETLRVTPLKKVPGFQKDKISDRREALRLIPPLLLAYLRLGAQIAGEPALDELFGVADFLVVLDREKVMARYGDRYFAR